MDLLLSISLWRVYTGTIGRILFVCLLYDWQLNVPPEMPSLKDGGQSFYLTHLQPRSCLIRSISPSTFVPGICFTVPLFLLSFNGYLLWTCCCLQPAAGGMCPIRLYAYISVLDDIV